MESRNGNVDVATEARSSDDKKPRQAQKVITINP